MMSCERCGDEVDRLLRHREHGVAVTHRVTRWLCRDCHPTVPSIGASLAESETDQSSESVVTDGGTAAACPDCSSSTVNVHGIHDCVECTWNSH